MQVKQDSSLLPPRWILSLIILAGAVWLLMALKELLVLLIIGFALAYVIEPVMQFFERRKISRLWAFFIVITVFFLFVAILFLTTWPTLLREGRTLAESLPRYVQSAQERTQQLLQDMHGSDSSLKKIVAVPFERLQDFGANILPKVMTGLKTVLLSGFSVTLALINLALLPFIVFYLTQSFPSLSTGFFNLIPRSKRREVATIVNEIDTQVAAFVRGQLLVTTILFVMFAIGLGAMGIELWLVLAVIAGYGNLIPYVGTIVGIVLCSVMALSTFGDLWHVVYVWILFVVIQMLEGSVITPRVIGNSVGLNPLIIILAIVACGSLFGLLGVMLAVPIAAALRVLLKYGHSWWVKQVDNSAEN